MEPRWFFGSPTRYGNIDAQLKQYLDTLGPLWQQGDTECNAIAPEVTPAIDVAGTLQRGSAAQ